MQETTERDGGGARGITGLPDAYLAATVAHDLSTGANSERALRRARSLCDQSRTVIEEMARAVDPEMRGIAMAKALAVLSESERASFTMAFENVLAAPDEFARALDQKFRGQGAHRMTEASMMLEDISWLWPGWIPKGHLTLLAGMMGVGKSAMGLRFAASAALGWQLPDGSPMQPENGAEPFVTWVDTESGLSILRDRMARWNFPDEQLGWPACPDRPADPLAALALDIESHWTSLVNHLEWVHPAMLVVDSLSGAHGGDENSTEMRRLMSMLADLTARLNLATVLIHHLRKAKDGETGGLVELDRIRGSSAIAQFPRSIIALETPDASDPRSLRLRVIKSNLGPLPEPLGASIDDSGVHFGAAPDEPRRYTVQDRIREFIRAELHNVPREQAEILARAEADGLSRTMVRRVAESMGVTMARTGVAGVRGGSRTIWSLAARLVDRQAEIARPESIPSQQAPSEPRLADLGREDDPT